VHIGLRWGKFSRITKEIRRNWLSYMGYRKG
jgi:hypothetical protein